jgi:hypothetical protein
VPLKDREGLELTDNAWWSLAAAASNRGGTALENLAIIGGWDRRSSYTFALSYAARVVLWWQHRRRYIVTPLGATEVRYIAMSSLIKIADWSGEKRSNVVFVHGLGGHPYDTWRAAPDDDTFWPLWLAEDIKGLSVYTLG